MILMRKVKMNYPKIRINLKRMRRREMKTMRMTTMIIILLMAFGKSKQTVSGILRRKCTTLTDLKLLKMTMMK